MCAEVDNDGDGYKVSEGDCNDDDATVHPFANEICGDGIDQNCDGKDLDCDDVDNDGDGYTENEGDCADNDASRNPGVLEICDSVDNNCDEVIDQDCDGKDEKKSGGGGGGCGGCETEKIPEATSFRAKILNLLLIISGPTLVANLLKKKKN